MRVIDADKLYPDCFTRSGKLAISQSQIAEAPTVERKPFATVTFDKDELVRIVDERVIEPIKNGELVIKEKRPTGKWIEHYDNSDGFTWLTCSRCMFKAYEEDYNFCPNCGAEMGKETEE